MAMQSSADAGFFSLVHEVLEAEKLRTDDRRYEQRQWYDCVQLIAPYTPEHLPAAADFRRVRCQDLSPGGISYIDAALPENPKLLVLLGPAPFIFLTAEVAHHTELQNGNAKEYLIGCRFTGRIKHDGDSVTVGKPVSE
jgi:hypothetical protein